MSIENKLLVKLLNTKEWDILIDKGITANYFTGSNRRAFNWLSDFKLKYGEIPDIETFKKHFPEVSLNFETVESLSYYCDEVRNKVRQNKLVAVLDRMAEKVNDKRIDECYEDLEKLLMEVNTEFTLSEKLDLGTATKERFDEYELSKITGGMLGIPLGIMPIDKQTGGVKDVDLFTFLAAPNTGKSFLLCIIASNLVKAGYKVLFMTKEMSPKQIMKRIDAIMANISYSRLKDGKLSNKEEEQFKTYLEKFAPKYSNKLRVELVTKGITECIAKIESYNPDIVLVDGGYLLSEGNDPEDWKAVISVWKVFKNFTLSRKIPIIATSQLTEKGNIAYASGLRQYVDALYILKQSDVQKAAKELEVLTNKVRDGEWRNPFLMNWDFTEMKYDVIYSQEPKKDSIFEVSEPQILSKIE